MPKEILTFNRNQKALIERAITQMETYPDRFDMEHWFNADEVERSAIEGLSGKKFFDCGASCCLAGHLVAATGAPMRFTYKRKSKFLKFTGGIGDVAASLLGFKFKNTYDGEEKAKHIFQWDLWPKKFRDMYDNATSDEERNKAGIARLKFLLATGK